MINLIINSKYTRYIDQGIYSLSTLSLSLLAPIFFDDTQAAKILYLISFLLLYMAINSAVFITQLLSMHSNDYNTINSIVTVFVISFIGLYALLYLSNLYLTIYNPYFHYFALSFCAADFVRRLFLIKQKDLFSLLVSIHCFLTIITAYFISSFLSIDLWKCLFYLIIPILIFPLIYYLPSNKLELSSFLNKDFIIKFSSNSLLSVLSFILVWINTQGIFVALYGNVDNTAFTNQKVIFSILGFANIIMLVQENKYQPLYSQRLSLDALKSTKDLDRKVNIEGHFIFLIGVIIVSAVWILNLSFYVALLLFVIYRYLYSLSKKYVYYFRATNKYQILLVANIFNLVILLLSYFTINDFVASQYKIPIYLVIQAVTFYIFLTIIKNRTFYEQYRHI